MRDLSDRPVREGLFLVLIAAGMIAATVWLFDVEIGDRLQACAVAAVMVTVAVACSWILRGSSLRPALAVFPAIVFIGLSVLGEVNIALGGSYSGFFILAFIYIGLRLPPRSTAKFMLPAAALWLVSNGAFAGASLPALEVRLPIALCLWFCVGELLSQQARSTVRSEAFLQRQADLDPLTDLHNRRALPSVFAEANGGDAIVLIDLDHFKAINDQYGHARGDQVLVEFAGVLSGSVREQDLVVRYGGEEFMLYLPDTTARQADRVLHRIRDRWMAQAPLATFSAGIATVRSRDDMPLAIAEADTCLYQAKDAGRDQWLASDRPSEAVLR